MDPVFYADDLPPVGGIGRLTGPEGRHAATVRRLRSGERLVVADGEGRAVLATVAEVGKGELDYVVLDRSIEDPPTPRVTVVQALPKSERSELAVELATEAGVDTIVPWQASRSVARWDNKAAKGVARWRSAATAAAKQSRRLRIPVVTDLQSTTAIRTLVADTVAAGGRALALHEVGATPIADIPMRGCPELLLIVGPEGGLSETEIADFTAVGAVSTILGPTVLRTSTAAAVALGAVGVLTDRWSSVSGGAAQDVSRDRG